MGEGFRIVRLGSSAGVLPVHSGSLGNMGCALCYTMVMLGNSLGSRALGLGFGVGV